MVLYGPIHSYSGYELTYCDSGNKIHFSFLMMQFFTPTQKIIVPKYNLIFPKQRKGALPC